MIVDCHTSIWESPDQLGLAESTIRRAMGDRAGLSADADAHAASTACVTRSLVMGFCSEFLGAHVPNDLIAAYVEADSDRLVGIAAVDPTADDAVDDTARRLDQDAFRGLVISPSDQNFHPADSRAMKLFELADQRGAVVVFRQGMRFHAKSHLEYARPILLDEIAREFPKLTIVITSLGYPWVDEALALLDKHERLFADTASLTRQPWLAYTALATAYQYRVMDKVLFASGYPIVTPAEAIETVYRLNEMTQGTNLPAVPREALRGVVERDSLAALGIARAGEQAIPDDAVEEDW